MTNKNNNQESLHAARVRLFQILCALDSQGGEAFDRFKVESRLEELFVEPEAAAENGGEVERVNAGFEEEIALPRVPLDEYRRSCALACAVRGALPEIDALIQTYSTEWKTERMSLVDRTIIRLALYEAVIVKKVPIGVALSEAVRLAKEYGSDDSPRFVNGVLARIVKALALS